MKYMYELIVWPINMPGKEVTWKGVWDFSLNDPEKSFDACINKLTEKYGKLESIVMRMIPLEGNDA